jgi:uncharacterized protein with GYD domain
MPSYLTLASWTDQGVRDIKGAPERLDAVKEAARAAGGRLVFFYMTMGQYDVAVLMELPDDETAARLALSIAGQGNVRTTTLKAFTEDETRGIIAALP